MNRLLIIAFVFITLVGCKNDNKKTFTVSGKITNTTGKTVFLEEVPVGTMRAVIVDSAALQKDGSFSLKTQSGEAAIYNLRIDQNMYPVAAVINDNSAIELNVTMDKTNNQFAEKYEVKGSPASQSMKDFMSGFNTKLQQVITLAQEFDSLRNGKTPDSVLNTKMEEATAIAKSMKEFTLAEIKKSENPALTMFVLGYYQSTGDRMGFGFQPLANEEVTTIINDVAKKYPGHGGVAALKQTLQNQLTAEAEKSWVGKQAPDFTLPDVNGKPVALNSFKGKYVLVDFWAGWCKPCRIENPTVVAAYNKFKDKNFTVLGVSLDENKETWLQAIKQDQLAWQHVSDLKYWESIVVPLYKFEGIPFNILLDPQGKVIAEGLRGPDLEAKLAEVLH